MKKLRYILTIIVTLAITLQSCELIGSIDDIKPDYKLTDETVIVDGPSAEAGINGVYLSWNSMNIGYMRYLLNSLTGSQFQAGVAGADGFKSNTVKEDNVGVEGNYRNLYYVVQSASLFIQNLNSKESLPGLAKERKIEMEAEAKYSRAQAYLFLLRQYGEFYNRASKYGIVIYPEGKPINDNTPIKRSAVEESYQQILADLDFAIAHAPAMNDHYRISQLTAKALKARVFLYMKDFANASALANEVLDEAPGAGYELEEDFKEMFKNSFESSEMLFAFYSMYPDESYSGDYSVNFALGANTPKIANSIIKGKTDKRFTTTFKELDPDIRNNKYNFKRRQVGKQGSHFYIRLAEMHYIVAETQARLGNKKASREALKKIICIPRAGYTEDYVDKITDAELMTAILHHKWMEFTTENNEEWFDLVRYRAWDNFTITTKDEKAISYVESDLHLLLPIPKVSLSGNEALEQNPGYATAN